MIFSQVVDVQILEEFDVDQSAFAELDIWTFVELSERFADVQFRHLILFDQDAFEIAGAFAGLSEDVFHVVLRNFPVADEVVEFCGIFLCGFPQVEKCNAEGFGDLGDRFFVFSRETAAALFVQ